MSKSHRLSHREKAALLRVCRKAIAIDSTNPTGNIKIAKFFGEKFRGLGFKVKLMRRKFCDAPQANLIARIGSEKGRSLVLNTHLDTVTTDPHAWSKTEGDPFQATIAGGRLYGLGSADTKLAMACQWQALTALKGAKWKRPLVITGTFGEEMGLVGAEHLKKKSWLHGAEVLNSEPSELRLAMGNRGLRIYEIYGSFSKRKKVKGRLYKIEFLGKAAHSARPQLGKNALLMAMKYLTELPEGIYPIALKGGLAANITAPRAVLQVLNTTGHLPSPKKYGGRVRKVRPVSHLIIHPEARAVLKIWFQHLWRHRRGKITQNVGFVDFSEKRWKLVFDLRLPVKGNVRKLEQLIKKYRKITHARIEIERDNPPFLQRKGMALHRQMARILRAQGLSTATDIKWGGTEASVFGQVAREVLTFGPGRLYGVAHQPNEYVPLKELYAVTEVYRELFRGMVRL